MAVGILKEPFNYIYFFTGVFNFGFSLFVRSKRLKSYKEMAEELKRKDNP
jgi:hypothetical protein